MHIKTVKVGLLETNCYILEKDNECLIIDPGSDFEKIKSAIDKDVVGIIITHSHFDHVGCLEEASNYYHVKTYNKANLKEGINNISNFTFEVIYTPGHLDDLITIYFKEESSMFVGDFIFKNSIGRTDLKGGNNLEMKKSIQKILEYPLNTKIYPGHYEDTTLKDELENLSFFMNRI